MNGAQWFNQHVMYIVPVLILLPLVIIGAACAISDYRSK